VPKIPGVNHQDAVRALQKVGFRVIRQGKHIVMPTVSESLQRRASTGVQPTAGGTGRVRNIFSRDDTAQLPFVLARCGERGSLTILPPFEPLSHSYVAPAIQADGSEVVLKVGLPDAGTSV
jgi:hypothetical protein